MAGTAVIVIAATIAIAVVWAVERTRIALVRLTVTVGIRVTSIAQAVSVMVALIAIGDVVTVVYDAADTITVSVIPEVGSAQWSYRLCSVRVSSGIWRASLFRLGM